MKRLIRKIIALLMFASGLLGVGGMALTVLPGVASADTYNCWSNYTVFDWAYYGYMSLEGGVTQDNVNYPYVPFNLQLCHDETPGTDNWYIRCQTQGSGCFMALKFGNGNNYEYDDSGSGFYITEAWQPQCFGAVNSGEVVIYPHATYLGSSFSAMSADNYPGDYPIYSSIWYVGGGSDVFTIYNSSGQLVHPDGC